MIPTYESWFQTASQLNLEEAWPARLYPDAEYRYFRDCGCLMCALAVMLRHCGIEKEEDQSLFNPWILNQRLIDCGAFTSDADLELSFINRLYPIEYLGEFPYSRETLAFNPILVRYGDRWYIASFEGITFSMIYYEYIFYVRDVSGFG